MGSSESPTLVWLANSIPRSQQVSCARPASSTPRGRAWQIVFFRKSSKFRVVHDPILETGPIEGPPPESKGPGCGDAAFQTWRPCPILVTQGPGERHANQA